MSISGAADSSSSMGSHSFADSGDHASGDIGQNSGLNGADLSGGMQTTTEQLTSELTTGEQLASLPTTEEQITGQVVDLDSPVIDTQPIQLAQSLMPGPVMRELEQQLQPLMDGIEQAMQPTPVEEMTPLQVVQYWAGGGQGPLHFGPDSVMSQTFSQGNGAQAFEGFLNSKFNGNPQPGDRVDNFDYKFTASRVFSTSNMAEHVVGSWENGTAVVHDDHITYSVHNTMGLNSLIGGRPLQDALGIEPIGDLDSDLDMTITWTTPRQRE